MVSVGKTDVGIVRPVNQDCYCIAERDGYTLAVVCDGMGGHKAGEIASRMATDKIRELFMEEDIYDQKSWLTDTYNAVNEQVFLKALEDESCHGMGTTMVSALIDDENTYIANTGDSRAYFLDQDDELNQITSDHSLINEVMLTEGIDYEEASSMIPSNIITYAIGIYPKTRVDVFRISSHFKTLLLCSDGLHGYVSDKEIRAILMSDDSVQEKAEQLIIAANEKGGMDNITVVVVQEV